MKFGSISNPKEKKKCFDILLVLEREIFKQTYIKEFKAENGC